MLRVRVSVFSLLGLLLAPACAGDGRSGTDAGASSGAMGGAGAGSGAMGGGGAGASSAGACAVEIAVGHSHSCARRSDGTLWCWGNNNYGQLGDSTMTGSAAPVEASALGGSIAEVSLGLIHSCARKTDGTLWCWGNNLSGQLGYGAMASSSTPVAVSALGSDAAGFSVGHDHGCAWKTDGTVWCWGNNTHGQLGDGTTTATWTPVAVSALGSDVVEVAAGWGHSCARKTDGTLWCWGNNVHGQLGDGTTTTTSTPVAVSALGGDVAEVSLGRVHSCARKTDGTLWCWGNSSTTLTSTPVAVSALGGDVAEVSLGESHSCARKTDGTLWCWGQNNWGQLGDGTTTTTGTPVAVSALGSEVVEVALGAAAFHSCARKLGGTVWCWGPNASGQLGTTTDEPIPIPVQVPLCP